MENLKYILNKNTELLKFAEQKATIIITVYGLILTLIYSNSESVLMAMKNSGFQITLSIIAFIFSFLAIIFAILCINPVYKDTSKKSSIYFGDISNFSNWEEYFLYYKESSVNQDSLLKDYTEQIFITSKITKLKFLRASWAIKLFAFSVLILLIQVFLYLIFNT